MTSFSTKSVHHLGFVVANLDETLKAWEALFGVEAEIKVNPDLQVRLGAFDIAGIHFVFNESTHPDSRWAKFLNENGEGLEHIAFEVDNIDKAADKVVEVGLPLRFAEHKLIHGLLTNFVGQDKMHGTAVEFMGPER